MTEREKVIKGLECCTSFDSVDKTCMECPFENDCVEKQRNTQLLQDALALLKEQEPKPIAYTDNPYTGLPVARCPKCGKFARQFHSAIKEETHYCPWCGQAVKWE